jgi:hypothetical protein
LGGGSCAFIIIIIIIIIGTNACVFLISFLYHQNHPVFVVSGEKAEHGEKGIDMRRKRRGKERHRPVCRLLFVHYPIQLAGRLYIIVNTPPEPNFDGLDRVALFVLFACPFGDLGCSSSCVGGVVWLLVVNREVDMNEKSGRGLYLLYLLSF